MEDVKEKYDTQLCVLLFMLGNKSLQSDNMTQYISLCHMLPVLSNNTN